MSGDRTTEFDETVATANMWLREIGEEMEHANPHVSYCALRGVLFALRDRMPAESVQVLGDHLPTVLRGLLFENYRVGDVPVRYNRREFLDQVGEELQPNGTVTPETATRAVLRVMGRYVNSSNNGEVRHLLPQDLRGLWPDRLSFGP